jgi:hypothetical protein
LAQQADCGLGDGERVGRVDTELRCCGGVGLAPGVRHVEVRHRADAGSQHVDRSGVHHQRRVHLLERAPFEEEHLPAATFLGGRADDVQRDAQVVDQWRECNRGADCRGRDDVVTARVTDCGKRVVLGAQREVKRTVPDHRRERGRQVVHTVVDRHCRVGQDPRRPRARLRFFEAQLRVRVDAVAQRDERVGVLVDRSSGCFLRVHPGRFAACTPSTQ